MFQSQFGRSKVAPALATIALTILIAACGGSASAGDRDADGDTTGGGASTQTEQTTDATSDESTEETVLTREGGLCQLLPLEDVEKALGAAAVEAEAEKSSIGLGHSCRVTVDEDTILDVTRSAEETLEEFKEAFEAVGLTDETVEGLGEFAYRAPGTALGGPGARLAVYTGERHIGVTVYADNDQATMYEASAAVVQSLIDQGK